MQSAFAWGAFDRFMADPPTGQYRRKGLGGEGPAAV
jgi:hypothetical protein